MAWFLGQSFLFIVVALLVGILAGWLIWGRGSSAGRRAAVADTSPASEPVAVDPTPEPEPTPEPQPVSEREPAAEPEPASAPAPVVEIEADQVTVVVTDIQPVAVIPPVADTEPVADTQPVADIQPVAETLPVAAEPELEPVPVPEAIASESAAAPVAFVEPTPSTVAAPSDNLVRIEGIGPKIATALVAAGIRTYADLADAEVPNLRAILKSAGLRFTPSLPTWPAQARLLADNNEGGFTTLTDRLVAGREPAVPATALPSTVATAEPQAEPTADPQVTPEPQAQAEPQAEPQVEVQAEPEPQAQVEAQAEAVRQAEPEVPADVEPQPEPVVVPAQRTPEAEATSVEATPAEATAVEATPAEATAPVPVAVPDDLKRIEGIGPKMAGALNAAGILTYEQLAAADELTIKAAISSAGMRFAPSLVTWPQQARLLADGDDAGFGDLTRRLVAGRETGRV